jgi:hypothetical protein
MPFIMPVPIPIPNRVSTYVYSKKCNIFEVEMRTIRSIIISPLL